MEKEGVIHADFVENQAVFLKSGKKICKMVKLKNLREKYISNMKRIWDHVKQNVQTFETRTEILIFGLGFKAICE